ncbi:hypothetical protein CPB84DRAFT_1777889 [Gymnopilus junonius]|uniref:Uncharacterized protein n=1 Tax=Gymnopilus junonius TaxID=109634 RepID=A0A9P5NND0_GYMJU|nr:hypothetical protein CPB84DRAFT_1777889 [Gymnopilus junonius]
MSSGPSPEENNSKTNEPDIAPYSYPPQRHAGKVGYGPNLPDDPNLIDRVVGLVDELKGKVTHNPDLVQHGHEIYTGEAKIKEILGDDKPFFGEETQHIPKRRGAGPRSGAAGVQTNVHETSDSSKGNTSEGPLHRSSHDHDSG